MDRRAVPTMPKAQDFLEHAVRPGPFIPPLMNARRARMPYAWRRRRCRTCASREGAAVRARPRRDRTGAWKISVAASPAPALAQGELGRARCRTPKRARGGGARARPGRPRSMLPPPRVLDTGDWRPPAPFLCRRPCVARGLAVSQASGGERCRKARSAAARAHAPARPRWRIAGADASRARRGACVRVRVRVCRDFGENPWADTRPARVCG